MNAETSSSASAWRLKSTESATPPTSGVLAAHSDAPGGLTFSVRFTDGKTEDVVSLWVGERETVRDVKRRIRLLRPATLASRRLRLIYLGRILTDGVLLVPWTASLLERQKQYEAGQSRLIDDALEGLEGVVKSVAGDDSSEKKGKGKAFAKGERAHEQRAIWLNCSVGDIEDPAGTSPTTEQAPQIEPLRGFDRLRDAGFSEEEIRNIRQDFHEDGDEDATADDTEHARALEDQWMEGAQGDSVPEPSAHGHYMTLLQGSIIGFCFPLLCIFFFRTQIFSRRYQMAIMLGFTVNLAFGLLQYFS